jgi:hypothetical protein
MSNAQHPWDLLGPGVWGVAEVPFDYTGTKAADGDGGWKYTVRQGAMPDGPLTDRLPQKLVIISQRSTGSLTTVTLNGRIWTHAGVRVPGPGGSGRNAAFEYGETLTVDSGIAGQLISSGAVVAA